MFVNLTSLLKDLNMDTVQFVSQLRQEIKERTGCCCSVGLGENIFLARMATKKAKPDGQYLLEEDGVKELLADLKVSNKYKRYEMCLIKNANYIAIYYLLENFRD